MGLNAITRIEEFFVNSLLASPDIPLDVNILRLADVPDAEGVVIFPKSITVRFTGSVTEVLNREPLVLERTMDFVLEISCQNHQTRSGHDYATYLLGATSRTLMNQVPRNTGFEVVEPLTLQSENFQGLTESSHFVYQQNWSIVIKEVLPQFNPDPCVARGDCSSLFPPDSNSTVVDGEVLFGNRIYQLKPTLGLDCLKFGGVILNDSGDLVTVEDNDVIYLTSTQLEEGVKYLVRDIEDSEDILVTVRSDSGTIIRSDVFCFTGRTVLGIFAFLTNKGKVPEKFASINFPYNQRVVIKNGQALAYRDPTNSEETPLTLRYGNLVFVDPGVTLNVGGVDFNKAFIPQLGGEGWLEAGTYRFLFDLWECDDDE